MRVSRYDTPMLVSYPVEILRVSPFNNVFFLPLLLEFIYFLYFSLCVRSIDHEKSNDKRAPTNNNNNQLDENCSWWPQIDTFKDTTKTTSEKVVVGAARINQAKVKGTNNNKKTIKITTTATGITRLERCSTLSSVQFSSAEFSLPGFHFGSGLDVVGCSHRLVANEMKYPQPTRDSPRE